MTHEWNIYGKGLSDEYKEDTNKYFRQLAEFGRKKINGELEKTPEESALLTAINGYFDQELKDMGLPYTSFSSDQFHLFDDYGIKIKFPGNHPNAYRIRSMDYVIVNNSAWEKEEIPLVFIHEAIRLLSYRDYYAYVDQMKIDEVRSGYLTYNPFEGHHEHFNGFDSAVTEKLSREIFLRNIEEISQITGLNLATHPEKAYAPEYDTDLKILDLIIKRTAY